MKYQYLFNNFKFLSLSYDLFDLLQNIAIQGPETTEFSQWEKIRYKNDWK